MKCMNYENLYDMVLSAESHKLITDMRDSGELMRHIPELAILDEYVHNPVHHPEGSDEENYGTALDHVIACMQVADSINTSAIAKLCVLMHDVGKGVTGIRYTKDRPYHNFYGHEVAGVYVAKGIFERMGFPHDVRDAIQYCIRNHMNVPRIQSMRVHKVENIVKSPFWPLLEVVSLCDDKSRMYLFDEKRYMENIIYARRIRDDH